jgi:hypothetical protein
VPLEVILTLEAFDAIWTITNIAEVLPELRIMDLDMTLEVLVE